ncbi:MAG: HutD/Ves family protein [Luteimonas sp.]
MERDEDAPRLLRAQDYRRERWRNGAGWTREVHAHPAADGNGWDWRLSIAEIDEDAPFSAFPGVDRELVLLEGNGLRLRFADGECVELHPPHERLRFAGERALRGELVDGPTRDFNLMWKRDIVDARLWHRPLVGSMLLFTEPADTWVLYVLAGQARLQDGDATMDAAQGDTLVLPGGTDARRRYPLDGGGELLVIRIAPAGTADAAD